MKVDPVKRVIWSDIAGALAKETNVASCLCYGDEFRGYLKREAGLPFIPDNPAELEPAGNNDGQFDLIAGWQVLGEDSSTVSPEEIFGLLKEEGEALLYGYYRDPRPEEILEMERRCRQADCNESIVLPGPGAVSMSRISGWLRESPFDRFTIRKKGIYYQAWLRKGRMGSGE